MMMTSSTSNLDWWNSVFSSRQISGSHCEQAASTQMVLSLSHHIQDALAFLLQRQLNFAKFNPSTTALAIYDGTIYIATQNHVGNDALLDAWQNIFNELGHYRQDGLVLEIEDKLRQLDETIKNYETMAEPPSILEKLHKELQNSRTKSLNRSRKERIQLIYEKLIKAIIGDLYILLLAKYADDFPEQWAALLSNDLKILRAQESSYQSTLKQATNTRGKVQHSHPELLICHELLQIKKHKNKHAKRVSSYDKVYIAIDKKSCGKCNIIIRGEHQPHPGQLFETIPGAEKFLKRLNRIIALNDNRDGLRFFINGYYATGYPSSFLPQVVIDIHEEAVNHSRTIPAKLILGRLNELVSSTCDAQRHKPHQFFLSQLHPIIEYLLGHLSHAPTQHTDVFVAYHPDPEAPSSAPVASSKCEEVAGDDGKQEELVLEDPTASATRSDLKGAWKRPLSFQSSSSTSSHSFAEEQPEAGDDKSERDTSEQHDCESKKPTSPLGPKLKGAWATPLTFHTSPSKTSPTVKQEKKPAAESDYGFGN